MLESYTIHNLSFVHRYIPAQPGGLPITLLLLHGTGGDETSLLPIAADAAPGTALLSPQGKTFIEDMRRFFPMGPNGQIDRDELQYQTAEVAEFLQEAARTYGFDARRVVALGYSNGAAMVASLLLLRPQLLAGAAILRPVLPPTPLRLPDLTGRPVFIAGGRQDALVPPQDAGRLAAILRSIGADVTLHEEDAGHKLRPGEIQMLKGWLAAHF
jgi:predicted esterase